MAPPLAFLSLNLVLPCREGEQNGEGRTTKNRPLWACSLRDSRVWTLTSQEDVLFFFPIKQCLHYRLPPPLSFRALFNSGGAWPKLRTDQRCKIKRFQHVYFMLSLMEGLRDAFHRGIKRTFLNCKNQTLTHKQRIYILYPWHPANVWKGFQTPHCVCVCVGENAQAF